MINAEERTLGGPLCVAVVEVTEPYLNRQRADMLD